jgi:hypothetical protein
MPALTCFHSAPWSKISFVKEAPVVEGEVP